MKIVLNYTCNGILLIDFLQRKISKNYTLLEKKSILDLRFWDQHGPEKKTHTRWTHNLNYSDFKIRASDLGVWDFAVSKLQAKWFVSCEFLPMYQSVYELSPVSVCALFEVPS